MPLGKKQRSACVGPNVSCLLFCVVEKIEWWKKKFILKENIFDSSWWLWKFKFNRWDLEYFITCTMGHKLFLTKFVKATRVKRNWSYKGFLKVFMHKWQLNSFILLIFVSWRNELEGLIKWFCLKQQLIIFFCFCELQYKNNNKKKNHVWKPIFYE